MVHLT